MRVSSYFRTIGSLKRMKSRAERRRGDRELQRAKKRLQKGVPEWTPFVEASLPPGYPVHLDKPLKVLVNSRYQVNLYLHETPLGGVMQLSIKRRDKETIHDWRDLQRIKNEIMGPEVEACELYPADSRLVDTSNQYHLWCLPEGMGFPFGYGDRLVCEHDGVDGSKQRPFDEDNRPAGCVSAADIADQVAEVRRGHVVSAANQTDSDD
jgi:hypothetical protein